MDLERFKKMTFCHLLIAITFFSSGLICASVQLALLVIKPFNPTLYRKLIYYPIYNFFSQMVCVSEWYGGSRLRVYMDPKDAKRFAGKEHGLMIMNHTYEIDWLMGWLLLDKWGMLGSSKAIAKKPLRYMPIIGWVWWMAEFVFLNRDFEKDKTILAQQLKVIFSHTDNGWLLLNAEGTRYSPIKHEASVKFAQEKGMTVLKHHLIPRTKGFTTSLPHMRGLCPAVYDVNLVFKRNAKAQPTLINILSGQALEPYMFIRRLPLEQVPKDEKGAANWLQNLYVEKDRIVDSFHETGSFFKTSGFKEVPCTVLTPRLSSLINFGLVAICSISSIVYFLISSLLAANWFGFLTALSIFAIIFVLLGKANNMSKISKASSYGAKKTN